MLLLSPRNNLEGNLSVLQGVECQIFLSAQDINVEHILSKRVMRTGTGPQLEELLDKSPVSTFPYEKTFKTLTWTHVLYFTRLDQQAYQNLSPGK